MVACDICKITTACTVEDKQGNLITPNSEMLFMLSACKYDSYHDYRKYFNYFENNKRVREWCLMWNIDFEW